MANNKFPIEDIFEETDKVSSGNASRPAQQKPAVPKKQPTVTSGSATPESRRPPPTEIPPRQSLRKAILIVLAIVVIAGGVAILLGSDVFNSQDTSTQVEAVNDAKAIDTNSTDAGETFVELPTVVASMIDTDGDGLSDEEEQQLGLNIQNQDNDSDGLIDWEEVKIYQTNPLKSDTDGDGNPDGAEVANGYNPKGPGLLLDLQAEILKLNN